MLISQLKEILAEMEAEGCIKVKFANTYDESVIDLDDSDDEGRHFCVCDDGETALLELI